MDDRVLLLNSTYEPLRIISWQRAVTLLFLEKVEVVEYSTRMLRTPKSEMPMPLVVRFLSRARFVRTRPRFTRRNIYLRDDHTCQYCGQRFGADELTFDHVLPKVRGGGYTWDNIVAACRACNRRKGGKLPHEARMRLLKPAIEPPAHPLWALGLVDRSIPEQWQPYLSNLPGPPPVPRD